MLRINQVSVAIEHANDEKELEEIQIKQLKKKILRILELKDERQLKKIEILKRSLDARKKPQLVYRYVVDVSLDKEDSILSKCRGRGVEKSDLATYVFPEYFPPKASRPVIVGTGPAGLFCGYFLARHGYRPILLERGKPVDERREDVLKFWETGILNPDSNVQFGEGGAGTFSDGKLNTTIKEKKGRNREVLRILVENGAPETILYVSKAHIGTDILMDVVRNMRKQILEWGGQVFFESKMTDLILKEGRIEGVELENGKQIPTDAVVLAIGHSARDTFRLCASKGIPLQAKAFSVGFRVEHPQSLINEGQYGGCAMTCLPAASYKLTEKLDSGRGIFSFCMCPGGYVVNASSEPGRLAVNGMSYSKRDGKNANSAILVTVTPDDFKDKSPLGGVLFQEEIETKAFQLGKGKIPVQYYMDFKGKKEHSGVVPEDFLPQTKGEYVFTEVNQILTKELNQAFILGMEAFHRRIPGFADDRVCVLGIESRTSSPVRILRNENGESEVRGLYPCGEGAGYAGGITSAAVDGIYIAELVAKGYNE